MVAAGQMLQARDAQQELLAKAEILYMLAAEAAEVVEVVLPIIIQAAAGDKADGRVRFRRFCLREPL